MGSSEYRLFKQLRGLVSKIAEENGEPNVPSKTIEQQHKQRQKWQKKIDKKKARSS